MKRTAFFFLVIGTALTAMFTTSCDEDITSSPLSFDNLDSASIRVYPKADLDLTTAGNEALSNGSIVTVTIPYSEYTFAGTGGSASSSIVLTDSVSSGFVEFKFPVDDNGVNATISIDGFEFDQVQADGSTETKFYNFTPTTRSVTLGAINIYEESNVTIVAVDESSDLSTATLVGNITCELNNQTAGLETAPAGTTVIVTKTSGGEDFETETTLDAGGSFSVSVDVNVDGTDEFEVTIRSFVTVQTQPVGSSPETENVEFASQTIAYGAISPGQVKTINTELDAPTSIDPDPATEFVTISGIIYSETDVENEHDDIDDNFNVRETLSNTTFTFFTTADDGVEFSTSVTTDGNGKYQVDVPVSQAVYLSAVIEMLRNVDTGEVDDDFDPIIDELLFRADVTMDAPITVTGGVTFEQGGVDVGSYEGADEFTWVEKTEL